MNMKLHRALFASIIMINLSGCAVSVQQPTTYSLTETPAKYRTYQTGRILMVMQPDAAPYYRTKQIAYEIKPNQISYFTRNAWAEPPAQMLHPLLVKSLQNTNHFSAIVAPPVTGVYDYMLNTQILTLRVNFDTRPAMVEVSIRAQIFNARTNRVKATEVITVFEPVYSCNFYNNVVAANHAIAKALAKINQFCIKNIN